MGMTTFNTSLVTGTMDEDRERFLEDFNWAKLNRSTPFVIYFSLLMLAGIVGNVVVFNVFYRRFNASVTQTFVLTMSVVDLLTNLVGLPVEILRIRYHATFYAGWECKLHWFVLSTLIIFSGLILVLVAVDRKRLVFRRYAGQQKSTLRKMKIALAVALGISVFLSIPRLVIMGQQTVTFKGTKFTGVQCAYDPTVFVRAYNGFLALWFTLNCVIMNVSYGRIACFLWHHRQLAARSGKSTRTPPKPFTAIQFNQEVFTVESNEHQAFQADSFPSTEYELSDTEKGARDGINEVHTLHTNEFSSEKAKFKNGNVRIFTTPQPSTSQLSYYENKKIANLNKEMVKDSSDESKHDDLTAATVVSNLGRGACCSTTKGKPSPRGRSKQIPKRTTLMLFVLSVVVVVNFLPFLVLELLEKLKPSLIADFVETNLYLVLSNTQYLNSVANPLVYSFCSARFRYECRELFACWKQSIFSRLNT